MKRSREEMVTELLDKQALTDLALTYFRAIDRRDFALLRSCYHPDAVEDRGRLFTGDVDSWIAFVAQATAHYELTVHRMFNAAFRIDGDYAEGEIYAEAYHRMPPPDGREIIGGGRYLDRYARREGIWRYIHRSMTSDRGEIRQVQPEVREELLSTPSPQGRPGAQDPSYGQLRLFPRLDGTNDEPDQ